MTRKPLAVGDIIHGRAYGAFGRDHYDCVRVEAVGPDWIVARAFREPYERQPEAEIVSDRRSLVLCQQARDEVDHHDGLDCPFRDEEPLTAWNGA